MTDGNAAALEDGLRSDFAQLRRERWKRTLAGMERDGLDALLLGREANVRYVSGARRLWTVGARPFAPGCAVVRRENSVHLVSTWDDGIPAEIPRANLMQTSWNPQNLMAHLRRIPGLLAARRIGIDGMTPLFADLLPSAFPEAEWINATSCLERARRYKTKLELACLRTAATLAEQAFDAMADEIRPGAVERVLTGRYHEEAAALGVTVPSVEASFCATPSTAPPTPRLVSSSRALAAGDLVTCNAGVLYAGYEGGIGRTVLCGAEDSSPGQQELARRLDGLRGALRAACRPGASSEDVCRAYETCGEPRPEHPILHGVGLGMEPPVAGPGGDPCETILAPEMVVAVYASVWSLGIGGRFARDTLHITEDGCANLTNGDA